jgi:hypothetical protein
MSAGFEIVNPTARVSGGGSAGGLTLKRISKVEGLRVGLLDNGMPHAGDFLSHLGAAFERRYKTPILTRRKGYTARSAEPQIIDEIAASCDVAVTGFGV